MSLFFERRSHAFPAPVIPPFPGANVFGRQTVTSNPDSAMQVPTVWACVSLLANSVAMMPLQTFRRSGGVGGISRRIDDAPVVVAPSARLTQSEFLHMVMVSLLLRGNFYARVLSRDPASGRPVQLQPLAPDAVQLQTDQHTGLQFYKITAAGSASRVAIEDMWHVKGLTMPGADLGLSPIAYAAATLGLDLASRQFASNFFDGDGIPKAIMSTSEVLTPDQTANAKRKLLDLFRAREPMVLSGGWKYDTIQVKPEESQFLATQQANVAQIARYFGVPPEKVGGSSGGSMTYSSVEQQGIDFLTYSVSFWLKRIEDSYFDLLPGPQFVRFDTSALLRTDAETQAKVEAIQIASKVRAPSEVRESHNQPPMTDDQKKEVDMTGLTVSPTGTVKPAPPGLKAAETEPTA